MMGTANDCVVTPGLKVSVADVATSVGARGRRSVLCGHLHGYRLGARHRQRHEEGQVFRAEIPLSYRAAADGDFGNWKSDDLGQIRRAGQEGRIAEIGSDNQMAPDRERRDRGRRGDAAAQSVTPEREAAVLKGDGTGRRSRAGRHRGREGRPPHPPGTGSAKT